MTITAKVVAHSRVQGCPDLITLQARYPRFIHAEFMTHRVFSRNASSSRAIPIERMTQDVIDDPAMPVAWGSNKPGMQAGEECNEVVRIPTGFHIIGFNREEAWLLARDNAVEVARAFAKAGYHKQIVNRLLEPFGHISVVVTATEWENFFALRCHPDADPTMRALAEAMRDAIAGSEPVEREWHLPYMQPDEITGMAEHDAMISAARCARVSYLNHDGSDPDVEKDIALSKRLFESKHMSPFEHQAQADRRNHNQGWDAKHLHGNLVGWRQFRKMIEK